MNAHVLPRSVKAGGFVSTPELAFFLLWFLSAIPVGFKETFCFLNTCSCGNLGKASVPLRQQSTCVSKHPPPERQCGACFQAAEPWVSNLSMG